MRNIVSIIISIIILWPNNVEAKCNLKCCYNKLQKLVKKLKKENKRLKKCKPLLKKKHNTPAQKSSKNSLEGLFENKLKVDAKVSASKYNQVAKTSQAALKEYKSLAHINNNFVARYNTRLRVRNSVAKKLSFYQDNFRKKRNYLDQLYSRKGEEPELRHAKESKYIPFINGAYMELYKLKKMAVPQITKDYYVSKDSYEYAVDFKHKVEKLIKKLKKDLQEQKPNHKDHAEAIKVFTKLLPIWKKNYEEIIKLELHVKKPNVKKMLAMCKFTQCDKPKILSVR